jgi:hypothetical protein
MGIRDDERSVSYAGLREAESSLPYVPAHSTRRWAQRGDTVNHSQ